MPLVISPEMKVELNELAREFYALMGYNVQEGFDFTKSKHPQERLCFELAKSSYDYWWEKFEEENSE